MVQPAEAQVGQRLAVTLQNFPPPSPNGDTLVVVPAGQPDADPSQGGNRFLFRQSFYSPQAQPVEIGPFAPGEYEIRYFTTLYNNDRRQEVSARAGFSVR